MAERNTQSHDAPLARRIAGGWLVLLSLGLTAVGVILAVEQAQAIGLRLMAPAEAEARRIASEAEMQFAEEVRQMEEVFHAQALSGGWRSLDPSVLAPWIDGVYAWTAGRLSTVEPARRYEGFVLSWIEAKLTSRSRGTDDDARRSELLCEALPGGPQAAVLIDMDHARSGLETVALRIDIELLRGRILGPLLPTDGYLILTVVGTPESRSPWSQRLFGPFRFFSIRPSREFIVHQQWTVAGQTALFLAMPILGLMTVLVAMFALKHTVRREIALAQMKANFVADVSHELKTPLALIRLFGETLLSGRVSSEEKRNEYYAVIMRESTRLTELIENILDFARIESGRKQYHMETTDLGDVVRTTYEAYRAQLDDAGFEHRLTIANDLPRVWADPGAIAQVVINLINNAIKYSDDERILNIELSRDTRRGRRGVVIAVLDRGIGISAEDRARLFDGFFRSADRRVREKGGTGLGLALVRRIVESHHGTLDVESRLVKGTTFRVFFPAWEADTVPSPDGPADHERAARAAAENT
jgi:signal transduction histidine kinase